jgi:hypothetical protein
MAPVTEPPNGWVAVEATVEAHDLCDLVSPHDGEVERIRADNP